MIPAPGRVLLRPIETESSIGRIQLLDRTRENWTPNQYEVAVIGAPVQCEDEDCDRHHEHNCISRNGPIAFHLPPTFTPGDWVLVRHRSVVPTDDSNLFIAWQDDILAILSVNGKTP